MTKVLWCGWAIQEKDGTLLTDLNGGICSYEKQKRARELCVKTEKPVRIAVVLDEPKKARKRNA